MSKNHFLNQHYKGNIIFEINKKNFTFFFRSTNKPFQHYKGNTIFDINKKTPNFFYKFGVFYILLSLTNLTYCIFRTQISHKTIPATNLLLLNKRRFMFHCCSHCIIIISMIRKVYYLSNIFFKVFIKYENLKTYH